MERISAAAIRRFRAEIWRHYRAHGREMPWRRTRDPYRIVVSEVMLQQTQVSRVHEKYAEFLAAFPTMEALARATPRSLFGVWQGLGYNRRPLALKRLAIEVVSRHGGKVPRDIEALQDLPGIGSATAGSIAAFAFNAPAVFIETNIRSVFIHFFCDGVTHPDDRMILPLVARTVDQENPREWYYALMDYGVMLKSSGVNPSRRSKAHRPQPRFEGSDRQVRGRIMKLLVTGAPKRPGELRAELRVSAGRLAPILRALRNEGLITKRGSVFIV